MQIIAIFFSLALGLVLGNTLLGRGSQGDTVTRLSHHGKREVGIYNGNSTTINNHKYLVLSIVHVGVITPSQLTAYHISKNTDLNATSLGSMEYKACRTASLNVGILKNGNFFCSGSIVSETWIITVGDCTKGLTASELTVVGSSDDGVTGKSCSVLQIVEHPDYGTSTLDYEYSCIQVSGKFYYWAKRALKLPTAEPSDNAVLTVAGYGYTDSTDSARELRQAKMTWLAKDSCETTYQNFGFTWSDRMACADNADGATLCKGDYGDALVSGGVLYGMFAGAATSGFCTSSAKPVILADVYAVTSWIQTITGAKYDDATL